MSLPGNRDLAGRVARSFILIGALCLGACSSGDDGAEPEGVGVGGRAVTGGAGTAALAGSPSSGGASSMGGSESLGGVPSGEGGRPSEGGAAALGGVPSGEGGAFSEDVPTPPADVSSIGANTTVGVDWSLVEGATSYRIYWSTSPGVTPENGQLIEVNDPGEVHAGLTNGTPYYYTVTAVRGETESPPSLETSATPGGEWVLNFLGHGQLEDLITLAPISKPPLAERNHVLLLAEGYLSSDLPRFSIDVSNWMSGLFELEPYSYFQESFVVWSLPRASATRLGGGDTAFVVPVTTSGSTFMTGSGPFTGELADRLWAAISDHPVPPSEFASGSGGMGTVTKATAAFLLLDPNRNPPQAGVSGLTTTVANPSSSSQRIATAFGIGHEHEFSHAFARLLDEYMEEDFVDRDWPTDGQSNVVNADQCESVPWRHLLFGAGINATDELIGAFGRSHIGFHSELLCQMNGSHENATYYGTSNLRADHFCNFCRELVAYRILSRAGVVASFDEWEGLFRAAFYQRFGMTIPAQVPQATSAGTTFFEPCVSTSPPSPGSATAETPLIKLPPMTPAEPIRIGGVILAPEDLWELGWLP